MITASEALSMVDRINHGIPTQDELDSEMENADNVIRYAARRGKTRCVLSFKVHGMDHTKPGYKLDLAIRDYVCEQLASHGFTFKVDPNFQQYVDVSCGGAEQEENKE